MRPDAQAFAITWSETCNSRDLNRIAALYSETVVFKSPRVRTMSGKQSGTLQGRAAVRDYWQRILERRPDLEFAVGQVFAGVDSIALEYRVGDLRGIEFMTLDGDGLICFAAGNDLA
jgi:ketosteroid isomerase-like protein